MAKQVPDIARKIADGREFRAVMQIEARTAQNESENECVVEGYATTFNERYLIGQDDELDIYEQIDKNAFSKTDISDVIMQYDHQGRVFARLSNGTLEVTSDEKGLFIRAKLGGTELGRQVYEEIRGGYTSKMSFAFTVDGEDWAKEKKDGKTVYTRTITSIRKLYDVSAVSLPANDGTAISARSLLDGVIEKEEAERLVAQKGQERKDAENRRARQFALYDTFNER